MLPSEKFFLHPSVYITYNISLHTPTSDLLSFVCRNGMCKTVR